MSENADPTPEEFVTSWLAKWGVEWPEKRAQQLVGDLRALYGWGAQDDGEDYGPGAEDVDDSPEYHAARNDGQGSQ